MERIQAALHWVIMASLASHVFCCVLPSIVSVVSLFAGFGVLSGAMSFVDAIHEVLHDYEIHMLTFSGVMLVLGWSAYGYSRKIDCHDTGCHHGPCGPKKDRSKMILVAASVLLLVNVSVLFFVH